MIDYKLRTMSVDGNVYKEGDWISLNGKHRSGVEGKIETVEPN